MAYDLQHENDERMATKINIFKLLQEVSGFAQLSSRPSETRPNGPPLVQVRGPLSKKRTARRKFRLTIDMQEQPDIPHPVPIIHLSKSGQ
jgi:hypothetical protein